MNEQTEACVQKLVETEAQKEFMRYAFLTEPKSELGRLISGAWKKFKKCWDEKYRPEVEAEVRGSILGKLNALKKEIQLYSIKGKRLGRQIDLSLWGTKSLVYWYGK